MRRQTGSARSMPAREASWELFEAFLAVMRGGSLSAASRALSLTQPTVRRRIEELEAALQVVLFTRAPNGLVPTEAATSTVHHAESMAASALALGRAVSAPKDAARGTVRVAVSEIMGVEVLPPLLAALLARHPGLQVELVLSNRNEDLLRRDADVAVRMIEPTQAALVARKAGVVQVGLYASKAYLARRPAPKKLDELRAHALVGSDRARGLLDVLVEAGIPLRPRDFGFRSDSDVAQLAAVRAGMGVGVCQVPLAAGSPDLVRVLPRVSVDLGMWIVTHEDLRDTARIRLMTDHLHAALGRYSRGGGQ
ncbi:MAG: LysR family transcriptional regulator [Polyangiaceae bacterium]